MFVTAGTLVSSAEQVADGVITAAKLADAAKPLVLLKANSGTDQTASAANVDTVAISGLTAKDTLLILYTLESTVAATTTPLLYNDTDAVNLASLFGNGNVAIGDEVIGQAHIRQAQSGATVILSNHYATESGNATAKTHAVSSAFTTNWTGSWTLALRHGGVAATGTFKWSWSVFKVAGQ